MAPVDNFSEGSGHGSVGRKREAAIVALLTAKSHSDAARACGISLRTLQRWLREPGFAEAYRQARRDLVAAATTRLRAAATQAVTTLENVASDTQAPPAARVSASRAILEFMLQSHEDEEIEVEIAKLEEERGDDAKF